VYWPFLAAIVFAVGCYQLGAMSVAVLSLALKGVLIAVAAALVVFIGIVLRRRFAR
jgi:hypothetical protein